MHSASSKPATSLRILLVENHEDSLVCLSRHLERAGHAVREARTAAEATSALAQEIPDLLLCDIGLPDGNGWEIVARLGRSRPRACIAMSGYAQAADIERSRVAGFDHHLVKPFLPSDLDALLSQL